MSDLLAAAGIGYMLGSVPMGVLLARVFGWPDPRTHGSRHTGAMNVSRGGGKAALAIVLIADMLKGLAAIWIVLQLLTHPYAITVAGLMVVIGHIFPVWLRFSGGMGLAPGVGTMLLLSPITVLAAGLSLAVIRLLIIKHTPRATIAASTVIPITLLLTHAPWPVFWLGTWIAILASLRHATDWNRVYE